MSSGASPTTVSSVVEPLEKSEFISPGISVESTSVINTTKSQHSDSAWRRRVHSQYNIVKVCTQSISTIPERVCCFDKPVAAESLHNNKDVLLWLFTQNNVQLYDLENSECQRIIQLPYSDISFVKPFYSSCRNIQEPLQIRGIMAIGLKNGDCILYDGYTGTYLQTLSPPATVSNNLSVSTISCSCPIVYSDCYLNEPTPVDWLLIGYGDSQFAQWQLDWKTDVPCSNVAAYKEWTISNTSHLKDAYYLSHLQLWIVLSNRAAFVMDPQGSVIYHYSTEWESFQLLIMECIFLLEQMERKILMLIISEEGMLQYCKMEYLSGSIRLEPLETSFLSFNDCTNICSCCHLCCNYFLLGSYDGGLSLFQWNQNSLGYIIPVCLYKKVVHSDKFHFVSCKREKENFTIRTYCPEENQLVTLSLVVKHKPECHSFITNDVQNTSSVIKREEKSHVSPSEQNMERRDIHYGNTVALSNSKERTSEMSTVSNEIGQTPFMAYRSNETTGLDVPYNSKSMLSETEQRLQLLQIEYEQERKIHQKLREELLNRALEAEEQVERLEAKLKQVQRMKRHPRESSKEDECSSPSIGTQDSDGKDKIALLEKQLREVSEAKQLLMTQAKEDIDYLQNRVEALDTVLLSSQQDLEDFISMTVEMNERIAEVLDSLTDDAFDQLGGFEEVFRQWMTSVRERLYRQRKRKEEVKEQVHILQNMFRVIDHSATNMSRYETTIQEESSPNKDAADATPRSRLLLQQVKFSLQHRIMQLEEQLRQLTDEQNKATDTKTISFVKELEAQLERAEERIHQLEQEKEQIAIAHDRLLEDNAALETENERLQLQLRRAVEAASYYSGRDTVSPVEPTTPREDRASTSSKN